MAVEGGVSLCLACGFCCDGTLFTRVPLAPSDDPSLRVALKVLDGTHHAEQPCAALEGLCCTVYDRRPLTCRRYRCLLLEAHEAGEVSEAGAVEQVEQTRALRASLAASLGHADAGAAANFARRHRESLTPEQREALARLERALTFHFLGHRTGLR
jgi:uncharacterized protein